MNNQDDTQIDRAEAETIADTFAECTPSWELLLVLSVTEGADEIGDESARCVTERLADGDARTILAGEIDRAYDDPSQAGAPTFPELIEPLITVLDACLSASERAQLDFN